MNDHNQHAEPHGHGDADPQERAGARSPRAGGVDGVDALLRRRASLPPAHPDRSLLRQQALEAGLPVAGTLARRYSGRGEPLADLAQVAAVGLVKAVDGFNPAFPGNFWGYATPTILGGIKRHFRDGAWPVAVPRRQKEMWLQINRCQAELSQRLMRQPAATDLAEQLGADRREVDRAMVAGNGYLPTSLFAQRRAGSTSLFVDEIGELDPGYHQVELRETLRPAVAGLPCRERRIIMLRFFGNLTQAQIASRIGISQMHVSRLLARGLRRLRASLGEVR